MYGYFNPLHAIKRIGELFCASRSLCFRYSLVRAIEKILQRSHHSAYPRPEGAGIQYRYGDVTVSMSAAKPLSIR